MPIPADPGAFKTPTLRDIANKAPYMHNGSVQTLEEVVDHYDQGGVQNPNLEIATGWQRANDLDGTMLHLQ